MHSGSPVRCHQNITTRIFFLALPPSSACGYQEETTGMRCNWSAVLSQEKLNYLWHNRRMSPWVVCSCGLCFEEFCHFGSRSSWGRSFCPVTWPSLVCCGIWFRSDWRAKKMHWSICRWSVLVETNGIRRVLHQCCSQQGFNRNQVDSFGQYLLFGIWKKILHLFSQQMALCTNFWAILVADREEFWPKFVHNGCFLSDLSFLEYPKSKYYCPH